MRRHFSIRSIFAILLSTLSFFSSIANAQLTDSDGDGLADEWEIYFGLNMSDPLDAADDIDLDGLSNLQEFVAKLDPNNPDSDFDFVFDGVDIAPNDPLVAEDSDGDQLPDGWEIRYSLDPYMPGDELTDYDADGATALQEYFLKTNPNRYDSDGDAVADGSDVSPTDARYALDSDGDGLPDSYENRFLFLDPFNAADALEDFDADQLSNLEEFTANSNPRLADSDNDGVEDAFDRYPDIGAYRYDDDNDGMPDEWEYQYAGDIWMFQWWEDIDGDGLNNLREFELGTDPLNWDSDMDFLADGYDHYPTDPRYSEDRDRDGMPVEYENLYGFSDDMNADGGQDLDGDFLNNAMEFLLGTDADRPDSDFDNVFDGEDLWPTDHTRALDDDNDGVPNAWEIINGYDPLDPFDVTQDWDGDQLTVKQEYVAGTNPNKPDTDGDGVFDAEDFDPNDSHYSRDDDLDGLPVEYENQYPFLNDLDGVDADQDWDGDGLSNLREFELGTNPDNPDTDQDGVWDSEDYRPLDPLYQLQDQYDSDGDGMPNEYEWQYGLDPYSNDSWDDFDQDLLSNFDEYTLGTDPTNNDTDGDWMMDGDEHFPLDPQYAFDSDRDGMPDRYEDLYFGLDPWNTNDGGEDPDNDQLNNSHEYFAGSRPYNPDSDFDGVIDGQDLWPTDHTRALDDDFDGVPNAWEIINGFDPLDPLDASLDWDGDQFTVKQEYIAGSNPNNPDSDGDGVVDGEDFAPTDSRYSRDDDNDGLPLEYENQFSFLNDYDNLDASQDWDGDQLSNLREFELGTNPDNPDTDQDGVWDSEDYRPLDPLYQLQDQYDSDADGMPNEYEWQYGLDPYSNDSWDDVDQDLLSNLDEYTLGTDPTNNDTDGDWIMDGDEHFPLDPQYAFDSDRDGMPDRYEDLYFGLDPWNTYDGGEDPDNDQLNNSHEYFAGSNPYNQDSDFDGVIDGQDLWPIDRTRALDEDNDGLPSAWEIINGFDPLDPLDATQDGDGDQFTVKQEYVAGSNPNNPDSDGDGVVDGEDFAPADSRYSRDDDNDGLPLEYENQFSFLNDYDNLDASQDWDGDQLSNLREFQLGTNPDNPDTDQDGVWDSEDYRPLDPLYQLQDQYDSDADGMPNEYEWQYGLDPYNNDSWDDFDQDLLSNLDEYTLGTDPTNNDTDGDWIMDGDEHFPLDPQYAFDSDRDGMPDRYEDLYFDLNAWNTYDGGEDLDNDQLNNSHEYFAGSRPDVADSDFDSVMDGEDLWPTDPERALDSDGDSLPDVWEILHNLDPYNPADAENDFDGDQLSVKQEYQLGTSIETADTDGDGAADNPNSDAFPLNPDYALDDDQDGLPNNYELQYTFLDQFAAYDAQQDFDGDGLNCLEEFSLGTNPSEIDTDMDGVPDGEDLAPLNPDILASVDGDHDQLPDDWEYTHGFNIGENDSWQDADADYLSNLEEFKAGTDPLEYDTDGDWIIDGDDRYPLDALFWSDFDRDTIPDQWEQFYGLNDALTHDAIEDPDGDGLNNIEEFKTGGDPFGPGLADRDNDGLGDFVELRNNLNPDDSSDANADFDADGLTNAGEIAAGTDLMNPDSDADGLWDGYEVQYGFNPNYTADATIDSDGDTLTNIDEFFLGTNPTLADTDGDGANDAVDVFPNDATELADTDGDGVGDNADAFPTDPTETTDTDGDGIGNVADTDDDGDQMPDDWEQANNLDPLVADAAEDADQDRYTNLREYQLNSDPQDIASPGSPFLQAGVVQGVTNSGWTQVVLDHSYTSMVVVTTPVYDLPEAPLVVRVRNAVGNSFEMQLARLDGSANATNISVHYTVVEEGDYQAATQGITMEAVKYNSTVTDNRGSWGGEASLYLNAYAQPVVVGQVMTANDPDFSVFWSRGSRANRSVDASTLYVGKHVAEDTNVTRVPETVGYIVFEQGTGSINGYQYEAAMGADAAIGLTSSGYSYVLQSLTDVTAAVVSQSGMDGNNGSWALLRQTPQNGLLPVSVDEDQLKDGERNHVTEEVSYVVFSQ